MTFSSPLPPFVVFDPLLWVGFPEAVKEKERWSCMSPPQLVGLRGRPFLGLVLS